MDRKRLSRIVGFLLVLMLAGAVSAAAEGIDLSGKNDDALVSHMEQVTAEVARRGIAKTATLAKGSYIAGVDLPAGKYVYTCLAKGDDWGSVTVYSDQGNGKQLLWDVVSAPDEGEDPETIFLTLHDGDRLKSDVSFTLTIAPGVLFR